MKKLELIESIIETANKGDTLKKGESVLYDKDYLSNKDLKSLLNNKYAKYIVTHAEDYNYIKITCI